MQQALGVELTKDAVKLVKGRLGPDDEPAQVATRRQLQHGIDTSEWHWHKQMLTTSLSRDGKLLRCNCVKGNNEMQDTYCAMHLMMQRYATKPQPTCIKLRAVTGAVSTPGKFLKALAMPLSLP